MKNLYRPRARRHSYRTAVPFENTHLDQEIILVQPEVSEVKGVVGQLRGILLGYYLNIESPARKILVFNRLVKITLVASRPLAVIALAFWSLGFLILYWVFRCNLTQKRSLLAFRRLKVWLPKSCICK